VFDRGGLYDWEMLFVCLSQRSIGIGALPLGGVFHEFDPLQLVTLLIGFYNLSYDCPSIRDHPLRHGRFLYVHSGRMREFTMA
jgi:hypothetical protein